MEKIDLIQGLWRKTILLHFHLSSPYKSILQVWDMVFLDKATFEAIFSFYYIKKEVCQKCPPKSPKDFAILYMTRAVSKISNHFIRTPFYV